MSKKKHLQKRKASRKEATKRSGAKVIFSSSLFGAVSGLVIMFALILLFCAIALSFDYPHSFLTPLSLFAIAVAAFFGGIISTRKNGGSALLCGLLSGALLLLLTKVLLTVLPLRGVTAPISQKLLSLGALPISVLGAFLGIPQSKNKSKHR